MTAHSPTLEVNLAAIARNWRVLRAKAGRSAAVVKANAYGLGVAQVSGALLEAGCEEFFVATLAEAVELRGVLKTATIYVFHGARGGEAGEFAAHNLIPVLNSMEQIGAWNNAGAAALHIDTGMCRLGIAPEEAELVAQKGFKPNLILSHLASAGDTQDPKNKEQLALLKGALKYFAGTRVSFANSSGIFLGPEYHFDLARPGCSLYGISPNRALPNPVENVVRLSAPVLQYRTLTRDQSIGYSATATAKKGRTIATVELGYADGFLRSLSNKAEARAAGIKVKLLGRVSMDMVSIDVTDVPEKLRTPDLRIEFICDALPVDMVAEAAGTIGYEVFTRIGARVKRIYS